MPTGLCPRWIAVGSLDERRTGLPSNLNRNARRRHSRQALALRGQTGARYRQCLRPRRLEINFAGQNRRGERIAMTDLTITLENRPGALARMGAALGRAGVSIEGGGAWVAGET